MYTTALYSELSYHILTANKDLEFTGRMKVSMKNPSLVDSHCPSAAELVLKVILQSKYIVRVYIICIQYTYIL